jgi:hypothetical protein
MTFAVFWRGYEAMGWMTEEPRFDFLQKQGIVLSSRASRLPLVSTQPTIQSLHLKCFPGDKAAMAFDQPLTYGPKNEWSCSSTPPYAFYFYLYLYHLILCKLVWTGIHLPMFLRNEAPPWEPLLVMSVILRSGCFLC